MAGDDTTAKLKDVLAKAKKQANFGLALGKSGGDAPVIEVSLTKTPEALEKTAKKAAGGNKTGAGTLDFAGGKLSLRFVGDPPPGCLRALKAHFKQAGVSAKIALVLPDGTVDEDAHDDAEGAGDAPVADVDTTAPARAAASASDAEGPAAEPAAAASSPNAVDQAAKITQLFKKVAADVMPRARADADVAAVLRAQTAAFRAATGAAPPDLQAARAAVIEVQKLVPKPAAAAETGPSAGPAAAAPAAAVARAHDTWSRAIDEAGAELAKLQAAITAAAEGAAGIGKVDKAFTDLRGTLAKLDTALTTALATGIGTADAGRIGKARSDAIKLAERVEGILGDHPILSRIDDNPFVKVRAAATLRGSLADIRRDLAA